MIDLRGLCWPERSVRVKFQPVGKENPQMASSSDRPSLFAAVLTALIAISLSGPLAMGQVTSTGALLQGTVQDPTNASIPGATVTITEEATGVAKSAKTDEAGRYIFS